MVEDFEGGSEDESIDSSASPSEPEGDFDPTPEELEKLEDGVEKASNRLHSILNAGSDILQMYLDEIGQIPLLTSEEAYLLAIRMTEGDGRPIPDAKTRKPRKRLRRAYFREQARIKAQARNHFVSANLRLAVSFAIAHRRPGVHLLDSIQYANLGLLKAADRFQPRRGYKFSTYAYWWFRQSINDSYFQNETVIRIPDHSHTDHYTIGRVRDELTKELQGHPPSPEALAERLGKTVRAVEAIRARHKLIKPVSLSTPVDDDGSITLLDVIAKDTLTPEMMFALRESDARIGEVLRRLHPREDQILRMRFGIGRKDDMTLQEVGDVFHLTRERIRQIQDKAKIKIRLLFERASIGGSDVPEDE